ncbi:hypothetical protein Q5585_22555, partial [Escherichia coli]|nr:hypothetical protein [Escherichia coli]
NRLIRCVCGKKIGPDPRNFNQRVSLGRNDLLIRTFPKTSESLQEQINIMQARGVEQTFKPNDIYFDPKNDMVYVWGTKTTRLVNVPDKTESSKWTYEWVLGMKNGRPRIAYVNQYSGTPNIKKITINGKEQLATLDNPPPSTGNK